MKTEITIETRYPECDRMQIIHHAVYPIWYEIARNDFFDKVGFSFLDMSKIGVNPAMVDLHLEYKKPATYPETLTIIVSVGQIAPKKLELFYEIKNQNGEIINSCRSFHIWTGPDNRSYNLAENMPEIYAKFVKAAEE